MGMLDFIRARVLIWQARYHADTARRLWLLSDEHHKRAGACLDRLEAGIASGRIVLT